MKEPKRTLGNLRLDANPSAKPKGWKEGDTVPVHPRLVEICESRHGDISAGSFGYVVGIKDSGVVVHINKSFHMPGSTPKMEAQDRNYYFEILEVRLTRLGIYDETDSKWISELVCTGADEASDDEPFITDHIPFAEEAMKNVQTLQKSHGMLRGHKIAIKPYPMYVE